MVLEFVGSEKPTLGVEIELQILDPETLDLIPKAELLLKTCKFYGLDRVKAEIHQSMLEVDTEISHDVKQCKQFLHARMHKLNNIAEELGLKLAISGTHPFQQWKDRLISKQKRYQYVHQKFQWLAKRINVYGLHVHVGVKNGMQALMISNALISYLPHLLALSANSPFWQGLDTGMQSSRINIMESLPFAGTPKMFSHWSEFENYYKVLEEAEVIGSLKDLYWFIRPNLEFGTIEFRICDAMSTLDETMALVALIQCLVVFFSQKIQDQKFLQELLLDREQKWIAPGNQWIAARDGLNGIIMTAHGNKQSISESLIELVDQLKPIAKTLNCLEELLYIYHIIAVGNGAQRQRLLFQKTQSLNDVVSAAIRDFALDVALAG